METLKKLLDEYKIYIIVKNKADIIKIENGCLIRKNGKFIYYNNLEEAFHSIGIKSIKKALDSGDIIELANRECPEISIIIQKKNDLGYLATVNGYNTYPPKVFLSFEKLENFLSTFDKLW